jgi:hypothetical protein
MVLVTCTMYLGVYKYASPPLILTCCELCSSWRASMSTSRPSALNPLGLTQPPMVVINVWRQHVLSITPIGLISRFAVRPKAKMILFRIRQTGIHIQCLDSVTPRTSEAFRGSWLPTQLTAGGDICRRWYLILLPHTPRVSDEWTDGQGWCHICIWAEEWGQKSKHLPMFCSYLSSLWKHSLSPYHAQDFWKQTLKKNPVPSLTNWRNVTCS